MKEFLLRPRSIAGAAIWGSATALVVFFGLVFADLIVSAYRNNFGPARQIDAIAVGSGYSISLDATPAHPWLAEYDQSIGIYGGDPRGGKLLGRVEIPMNTGGRVRIGVLIAARSTPAQVVLADRLLNTRIDLSSRTLQDQKSWKDTDLKPIGIISGESYPVKFIPCAVWPFLSTEEQDAIMRPDDQLRGFCDAAQPSAPLSFFVRPTGHASHQLFSLIGRGPFTGPFAYRLMASA